MGHGDDFGDYIVFVDESGDQSLEKIDSGYPVFVLSFCIFEKKHYYSRVVPETLRLKFDFFGSDIPILHEREIRKRENDFRILMDTTVRESFFARLNAIMTARTKTKTFAKRSTRSCNAPNWSECPECSISTASARKPISRASSSQTSWHVRLALTTCTRRNRIAHGTCSAERCVPTRKTAVLKATD